ncbi:MAG TPA: hypothetical protein PK358_13515 [Spirochaetota bacterium]|nr:hypothetical protein [Spirochaetota bacterium]
MYNKKSEMEIIKEPEKIRDLYNSFFSGKPAFMKYYSSDIQVNCRSYSTGHVLIAVPSLISLPDPVIIFSFNENNMINFTLKKTASFQDNLIQFIITRCHILPSSRNQNRSVIDYRSDNRNVLYITNLITETVINNSLIINHNKISTVFNYAEKKLKQKYLFAKICTATEIPHDTRMQYIHSNHSGYIVTRLGKHNYSRTPAFDYYMNYIYPGERTVKAGLYRISEGLFPFYYKNKIPYGYLRINKETAFSQTDIKIAENLVKSIDEQFSKLGIFPVIKEKILVQDISPGGFSTLQSQKKNVRIFKNGNLVCCDLVLPDRNVINILGKITYNTSRNNGIIRSGMKIEKICDDEKDILHSYLNNSTA